MASSSGDPAANGKGITRLDRLLTLLDTGGTPATRRNAAQQIGELVGLHKEGLRALLAKIHRFLRSKKWDTRVAAGQAVGAIAQNVPHVTVESLEKAGELASTGGQLSTDKLDIQGSGTSEGSLDSGLMQFSSFDIQKVLEHGALLLSSGGEEYDSAPVGGSIQERLAQQRQNLKRRLGLEEAERFLDVNQIFEDEDLVQKPAADALPSDGRQKVEELISGMGHLSARERNQLKRKAKAQARGREAAYVSREEEGPAAKKQRASKTVVTEQPQDGNKVMVEAVADEDAEEDDFAGAWPFSSFCDRLLHEMFDPVWEIRHGAIIALREILSSHASSAGITKPLETSNPSAAALEARRSNEAWLEDCAVRLLCIFALDRFGDFVSDQTVAPIRETTAQALGAVLRSAPPRLVASTLSVLSVLRSRPEWQVRHGALLSLKYLVAVRPGMIPGLLAPHLLPAALAGLRDRDDDVIAASADALLPAAGAIAGGAGEAVPRLLRALWDALLNLDDLSPSIGSVMRLLAELYAQPGVAAAGARSAVKKEEPDPDTAQLPSLENLVPRLWPFMRHTITTVRSAAITTLERLLNTHGGVASAGGSTPLWVSAVLSDALRLTFQNLLLEVNEPIVASSRNVWEILLHKGGAEKSAPFLGGWFALAATPSGMRLDASLLLSGGRLEEKDRGGGGKQTGGVERSGPLVGAEGSPSAVEMRAQGGWALARLGLALQNENIGGFCGHVTELLQSPRATSRQLAGTIMAEWFKGLANPDASLANGEVKTENGGVKTEGGAKMEEVSSVLGSPAVAALRQRALELLQANDAGSPTPGSAAPYADLKPIYTRMREEAAAMAAHARAAGVKTPAYKFDALTPDQVLAVAAAVPDVSADAAGTPDVRGATPGERLAAAKHKVLVTVGALKEMQAALHRSVRGALAGAVVFSRELPPKLNSVIQPLMASVRFEGEASLQLPASRAIAELVLLCRGRTPSPNDKVLKNVCGLACADQAETPVVTSEEGENEEETDGVKKGEGEGGELLEGAVTRRGAEAVLSDLCNRLGPAIFEALPKLWECMTEGLVLDDARPTDLKPADSKSLEPHSIPAKPLPSLAASPQSLVSTLQAVRSLAPSLHPSLHATALFPLLPSVFACARHSHVAVRLVAGRCIATLAEAATELVMLSVLSTLTPMLGDAQSAGARRGAAGAIAALVNRLEPNILVPYCPLLVVPLLGRMADPDERVRRSVTHSFAALVPLLPLARGAPPPRGLDGTVLKTAEDARFLEQLLDSRHTEDYRLPIHINGTLRRYQQEGVNWLAFLKRFKLHGVLCDDMGLGKTLQATAIVAAAAAERAAARARMPAPDNAPLPSLVVCPPTLVGHWAFEIEKFVGEKVLSPLQYQGSPAERARARALFPRHSVVVMSYDSLRKDVEELEGVAWLYVILDEGHVIKNAKSKIAEAAKRVRAEHRLILSGTPIQNNVLELWSLFDFLMPGFLGTEREFNAKYGKPLAAARNPKCTPKQAEAGVLALEALHKQVMPFLLRRTKEEVLTDLPPKIIQDRIVDLSPLQVKLYEDFSRSDVRHEVSSLVQGADAVTAVPEQASTHVFQALQYLRKLCSHPLLVAGDAPERVAAAQAELPSTSGRGGLHSLEHSPKLVALKEILDECGVGSEGEEAGGQHRVLIFAQLKGFLDIIEKDLFATHMPGVSYLRLDGGVEASKRFDVVRQFNADPTIDVLLLTTHVGGLGLNLTSADTVVFVEHDWNPMRDLQAMDRAHRLGQQRVVNVYRLITRGTLEEKIMGLQRFKLSIANTVVSAENASLDTMNTGQLLDLFSVSKGAQQPSAGPLSDDAAAAAAVEGGGVPAKGKGLKAMLGTLEELWDESQYSEEYDLSNFLTKLKK